MWRFLCPKYILNLELRKVVKSLITRTNKYDFTSNLSLSASFIYKSTSLLLFDYYHVGF